jgi:hypothetical protein
MPTAPEPEPGQEAQPSLPEPQLPQVFTRAQARAAGCSDRQVTRRLKNAWESVRRGVAIDPTAIGTLVPAEILAALLAHRGRPMVVSHASALTILNLPEPLGPPRLLEFTATEGPTRKRDGVHIRVAPLPPGHVVRLGDTRLTSPTRTVVDCARTLHPRDGLAIADAALRIGIATHAGLLDVLAEQTGWPGVPTARAVLSLASPHRESPLESWSAWTFHQARLPSPAWQPDLHDQDGHFLGRPDCWWPGVAGEADGRAKYALAAAERGGADARRLFEVLDAERRREQGMRGAGVDVVRWGTTDILEPRGLITRLTAAIERAESGRHFRGLVSLRP